MTDCDLVFTKPYLEKSPLEEVPLKPDELLFPTRFVRRAGRGEALPPCWECLTPEAVSRSAACRTRC